MTLGEKVKYLRVRKNKTQLELSELIGLTLRSVKYYEKNERYPEDKVIKKIAIALDSSLDFLKDETKNIEFTKQEIFLQSVKNKYGTKAENDAKKTLEKLRNYLHDDINIELKEAFLAVIEDLYFEFREIAKNMKRI